MSFDPSHKIFPSSAALQDYLLKEAGPQTLVVVPHQRLAHQVWHRQRTAALAAGRAAWEPLPLVTLRDWWADLFQSLWLPVSLAIPLKRLGLWQAALRAGPALTGTAPGLEWAQALDEAYDLLCRHSLPPTRPDPADSPLIAWRRQITGIFLELLGQERLITQGELPAHLLKALSTGKIALPERILLVGLQTPAPVEEAWLKAVALRTKVLDLRIKGDPQAVQEAVVLPDPRQELEWVAAQLVKSALKESFPGHRLAVTSPDMDNYAPLFRRVLGELLGPPQGEGGWAYNFSQGPALADTPLFQAALLPLKFSTGELREDLVSLLLSPYYGVVKAQQAQLAQWDRLFREHRVEQGWERFRRVIEHNRESAAEAEALRQLHQVWASLRAPGATGRECIGRLQGAWQALKFPEVLEEAEQGQWSRITALLQELEASLASESLNAGELLDWLTHGARQQLLPGPGVQEAGIQILGLLEMRGLDFSRVWFLGKNSGAFPQPPRPLPLLNAAEKRRVLGGTYQSQHHFARELYDTFLGTAPEIILTRPQAVEQEDRVATPLYPGQWNKKEMAPLSRPDPAWLRVPAVQAAFTIPEGDFLPKDVAAPLAISLPGEVSLTQAQTALRCSCRFLLEILLRIRELPEMESGLSPRERGERLHQVLARFAADYNKILDQDDGWDQPRAREVLKAAAHRLLQDMLADLHWQAEWERWLGEGEAGPGLLWKWLKKEEERFEQGWRWQGLEVRFKDLKAPDWPFALKGRIDRIDYHEEAGELVVWDYKTGKIPGAKKVFEESEEFQLPGYLLAVKRGLVPVPPGVAGLRAGFITLKSSREKDLKYEDFEKQAARWEEVVASWAERIAALGRRLAAGDFSPQPTPAPRGRGAGACEYCPYSLVCGFMPEPVPEDEEEE